MRMWTVVAWMALVQFTTCADAGPYDEGLKLNKYSARKGGFDSVMIGTFTIENANTYFVKDVEIICDHFAPSGTKLGTSHKLIYESIGPGQKRAFSNVNVGFIPDQSKSFSCRIGTFTQQ